jgi:hypothetical protein
MKYLVIAALVSIVFVLVYSRIRPYLKLMQKVAQSLNVAADIGASTVSQQKTPSRNKLVRCESCGTWIPAERAMRVSGGLATYCSAECMAQTGKERKLAG